MNKEKVRLNRRRGRKRVERMAVKEKAGGKEDWGRQGQKVKK